MTLANESLWNKPVFCSNCGKPIPADRLQKNRRSVTCSDECGEIRARVLRKHTDDRICRFCHKPSTPAQREAFARYNKWQRANPELVYPKAWAIAEAAGMTLPDFAKAAVQAKKRDVILDPKYADAGWGSTKLHKPSDPTPELDRLLAMLGASAPESAPEGM